MSGIRNIEKNVLIDIQLVINENLDVNTSKSDYEKWVPFTLKLDVDGRITGYNETDNATFTLYEVKKLIEILEEVIINKRIGKELKKVEFVCSESFFSIIFDETYEENQVYVELWLNTAISSKGHICGYEEGVKFVTSLDDIETFKYSISNDLNRVLKNI